MRTYWINFQSWRKIWRPGVRRWRRWKGGLRRLRSNWSCRRIWLRTATLNCNRRVNRESCWNSNFKWNRSESMHWASKSGSAGTLSPKMISPSESPSSLYKHKSCSKTKPSNPTKSPAPIKWTTLATAAKAKGGPLKCSVMIWSMKGVHKLRKSSDWTRLWKSPSITQVREANIAISTSYSTSINKNYNTSDRQASTTSVCHKSPTSTKTTIIPSSHIRTRKSSTSAKHKAKNGSQLYSTVWFHQLTFCNWSNKLSWSWLGTIRLSRWRLSTCIRFLVLRFWKTWSITFSKQVKERVMSKRMCWRNWRLLRGIKWRKRLGKILSKNCLICYQLCRRWIIWRKNMKKSINYRMTRSSCLQNRRKRVPNNWSPQQHHLN